MTTIVALAVQTVLVVPMTADAVRFGVPVRAADLASGLRLSGPGRLQWRRLPVGGARADPVWIELAIAGAGSTARIVAGGDGPSTPEGGPVYAREVVARPHEFGTETVTRWHWVGGATDERVRVEFRRAGELDGECYGAGEARTRARPALGERAVVATELARRPYEVAAVLPPAGRPGLG
ncbi:MAG: hypothetical protein KDE27_19530, partial [Planctomycetes bacterium]|nr:hypothetical protein [Planctomycetota bacterium]